MRLRDYSKWVWNEVKETKTFTLLNIIGVWISVCVVTVFLSLALGIEQATIKRITEDVDLFTLEVSQQKSDTSIGRSDLNFILTDSRVRQFVPVLAKFVKLSVQIPEVSDTNEPLLIYTENYFADNSTGRDVRTDSLSFIEGRRLSGTDQDGLIISETTFNKLGLIHPALNRSNFDQLTFIITIERYNAAEQKEVETFPCRIIGIAKTTPYNGALVYISSPLAEEMDDWAKAITSIEDVDNERRYDRFDVVASNLDDLESLRKEVQRQGYKTSSILDRIDNVRQLLVAVRVVFFLIFGISVLIAGFNIVITLTSAVLKRKHEIGILKSIGATDMQVQGIFFVHAVYLSASGSLLGALSALIIIQVARFVVAHVESLKDIDLFNVNIGNIAFVIMATMLLSMIASLVPARRAASITPIETLREM